MRQAGCYFVQGYYTGYPMDVRQFEALLQDGGTVDLTRPAEPPSYYRRQPQEADTPAGVQPR